VVVGEEVVVEVIGGVGRGATAGRRDDGALRRGDVVALLSSDALGR